MTYNHNYSPFVLNSIANATVDDLERLYWLKKGLSDAGYSGIVEGYFKQDEMSSDLCEKLTDKKTWFR